MPLMYPRASATLVDSGALRFLQKYKLPLEALQPQDESSLNQLLEAQIPTSVEDSFSGVAHAIETTMGRLVQTIPALDPTLQGAAQSLRLAAGAPVATIVKLHPLRLRLAVPERDSTSVRVGQSVVVTVEGVAGEHKGRVARVSPSISEQNRTLLIEAEVPNEGSALRPGAFAKAEIVLAGGVRVVTVPATAVVTFAGVEKVLTVDKDKAAERRVQTGRRLGDRVEIVAGLPAGTPVVTQPGNLTAGQPVTVEP
jgi:multidrug efflux pump subunit AcrA (membrane-fusion protein)